MTEDTSVNKQCTNNQITGLFMMGFLTTGTIGTGFALICMDYISAVDYGIGFSIGVIGSMSVVSGTYLARKYGLFNATVSNEELPLMSVDIGSINEGKKENAL